MSDKWFLDTNLLVYAYDTQDRRKLTIAQEWVEKSIRTGKGVLSAQVLSEFFVVVTRRIKNPLPAGEAQECIHIFGRLEVVEIDRLLVHQSIDLHRQYRVSYWDAMIIAAAERAGCSKVLSEDLNEGQRYNAIEIQNPFRQ